MTKLFEPRLRLTPCEYNWAREAHTILLQSTWSHLEVQMAGDVIDWSSTQLAETDKSAISGILRGFTLLEHIVGDNWSRIGQLVPKPEITGLCSAYSAQEAIHAYAYVHLEDTLGLDTYPAFLADEHAQSKLSEYMAYADQLAMAGTNLAESAEARAQLALNLAVFGGIAEGTSLFSSFAVLLSYSRPGLGLFKGMQQLLSWSVRDENKHSEIAIKLFHELIGEYPQARPSEKDMHLAFACAVEEELAFVGNAFASDQLAGISYAEAESFVKYRANKKLAELRYKPYFSADELKLGYEVANWFEPLVGGSVQHDFFAQAKSGASYASARNESLTPIADIVDLFDV